MNTIVPVARILTMLAKASRSPERRDEALHDAVIAIMDEVGADALIFRVGREHHPLAAFRPNIRWPRRRKDLYTAGIAQLAEHQFREKRISDPARDPETGEEFLFCFPGHETEALFGDNTPSPEFFCFVSGLNKDGGVARHRHKWRKIVQWSDPDTGTPLTSGQIEPHYREAVTAYCHALDMVLMRRNEADSIVAPQISDRFWNLRDDLADASKLIRPWERVGNEPAHHVRTASLSFDLRSSTFIMEHAIDKEIHARWLQNLTKVLKAITQCHCGVFDKFTGDGVLVHFPVYAFERNEGDAEAKAARNGVACAWDMIRAAELCGEYMLYNLSLRTEHFGASAGVAIDDAVWSIDESGGPIVVGRGVVQACRLSVGHGDLGVVLTTNAVLARLEPLLSDKVNAKEEPFVSKEYQEHSHVLRVRMTEPPAGLGSDAAMIRTIVKRFFGPKTC